MHAGMLIRMSAFVLIASSFLFAQQTTPTTTSPQAGAPAQQQAAPSAPPATNPAPPSTPQTPATEPSPQAASPKTPQTPKEQAWQIIDSACAGDKTADHAMAIRVLGLMPDDGKALTLAEQALENDKPEIRAAGASALGDMKAKTSIPKLKDAIDDKDPLVALSAAHALELMHDDSAYEVYYEILTRQRKTGKGIIASETSILKDPKKMAQLGFEEGIGFIPFAGIGYGAVRTIMKDDSSPVRAAAARVLAHDPDPETTKALANAASDKSWLVRAAALEALAKREDPTALDKIAVHMYDDKALVKYTAAATVLRLTTIKEERAGKVKKKSVKSKKSQPQQPLNK
jgi:HEAT repeats